MLVTYSNLSAQTESGTYLLGGNAQFLATGDVTVLSLSPNVGYFVADNWALGLRAALVAVEESSSWNIGPFTRYYFGKKANGKFFGQLAGNIGGSDNADVVFGLGVGAGYALFLNQSVALEFTGGYERAGEGNGIFGLGVGFQIHFKKQ